MRLKSLDNCIIQNNNMMQYIVHYFSELNKKKEKNYINLWQYGYTSHVITSSHCKAPKTTSTHSLQNLWWVHKFLTYFFVLSLDIYKKKKKNLQSFLNNFLNIQLAKN